MKTELKIEGMHCAGCAGSIERSLRRLEGVQEVLVDFNKKRAIITHAGNVCAADLVAHVNEIGFQATTRGA